jgi:hypothetical protein
MRNEDRSDVKIESSDRRTRSWSTDALVSAPAKIHSNALYITHGFWFSKRSTGRLYVTKI